MRVVRSRLPVRPLQLTPSKVSNAAIANSTRRSQMPDAGDTAVLAGLGVKPEELSDTFASRDSFDGTS